MKRDWFLIVVLAWTAILFITLARHALAQTHDYLGYLYPKACQNDLSHIWTRVDRSRALGWYGTEKRTGAWEPSVIYIDKSMQEWPDIYVITHHMKCHELMFRTTGNPNWHPGRD